MSLASCDYYIEAPAAIPTTRITYSADRPLPSPAETLLEERLGLMTEFLVEAYDEDGFEPSLEASTNFEAFLRQLPIGMPATEPRISYFGSICMDWDKGPESQLTIMLQAQNKIGYAAYFSGEKVDGSVDFEDGRLSKELVENIQRWVASDHRAA